MSKNGLLISLSISSFPRLILNERLQTIRTVDLIAPYDLTKVDKLTSFVKG